MAWIFAVRRRSNPDYGEKILYPESGIRYYVDQELASLQQQAVIGKRKQTLSNLSSATRQI